MENVVRIIVVPENEWRQVLEIQAELLRMLKTLMDRDPAAGKVVPFITAIEFMHAVRIGRTKFDQLVAANKVKIIKKDRKIYVPVGEVERYFGTV
jgi:hypothetical protein